MDTITPNAKNVTVFYRGGCTNFGDIVLAESCRYLIEKVAKEQNIPLQIRMQDIYEEDLEVIKTACGKEPILVFPGGGMNSVKFNRIVKNIMTLMEDTPGVQVYFNGIGILRINPKKKNEDLLRRIFNKPEVQQVTTRGDYNKLLEYIEKPMTYPVQQIYDPAVWAGEAYGITKNPESDVIGVGVIRPEIFQLNGNEDMPESLVEYMYESILGELTKRGYRWQLFTNGMKTDYQFGVKLLEKMGLDKEQYLGAHIKTPRELVEKIAGYRGVIAARMHANIIATALDIPSVGLVWNDKMHLFAQMIFCEERYIPEEYLLCEDYIVDQLEAALEHGYDHAAMEATKCLTLETIHNILR